MLLSHCICAHANISSEHNPVPQRQDCRHEGYGRRCAGGSFRGRVLWGRVQVLQPLVRIHSLSLWPHWPSTYNSLLSQSRSARPVEHPLARTVAPTAFFLWFRTRSIPLANKRACEDKSILNLMLYKWIRLGLSVMLQPV